MKTVVMMLSNNL